MPQDAAASGATSDADSTKKGDQTDADAGQSGDSDSQPDIEKIVSARLNQKLKSLNVKELERKASEYDKLQQANQSETERYQARIAELEKRDSDRETERQHDRVQTATVREAAKLGFRDPSDAYRLLDAASIDFDDAGQPTNVGKLLSGLLKDKPYLASVNGSADGGQRGESGEGKKMNENELIRAALQGRA
jgi:hypothetical protein